MNYAKVHSIPQVAENKIVCLTGCVRQLSYASRNAKNVQIVK